MAVTNKQLTFSSFLHQQKKFLSRENFWSIFNFRVLTINFGSKLLFFCLSSLEVFSRHDDLSLFIYVECYCFPIVFDNTFRLGTTAVYSNFISLFLCFFKSRKTQFSNIRWWDILVFNFFVQKNSSRFKHTCFD